MPEVTRSDRAIPETLSESPRSPGEFDGLPRFFSPIHPEAVASLGDEFTAHSEARSGRRLLWWQWVAAQRAYEVRADGSPCWPLVFVSVVRQQGKSTLLTEDAIWWCARANGTPQLVLSAANSVTTARMIQSDAWQWAEDSDLVVRRQLGESQVVWPGGSSWTTVAVSNAYGRRPDRILLDEGWHVEVVRFWDALFPALAAKRNAQVIVFSAPNQDDRGLARELRSRGDVCRLEWGALPGEDLLDPVVWRLSSAWWSPGRLGLMRLAAGSPAFAENWLGVWPGPSLRVALLAEDVWAGLRTEDASGPVVAVGVESERGEPPVVAVVRSCDAGLVVSVRQCVSLVEAVRICSEHRHVQPRVGKSLLVDPAWREVFPVGEMGTGRDLAGEFRRLATDGVLRHDGGALLSSVVAGWSGRPADRSDALKAAVWAVRAARVQESAPAPMIF